MRQCARFRGVSSGSRKLPACKRILFLL